MLALALSLILTILLLALPVMAWRAYKTRRGQETKTLPRLLAGCCIAAWFAQALRYALLATAQNPLEVRHAAQLSAPLGWLVWLAALAGVLMFAILSLRKRRP